MRMVKPNPNNKTYYSHSRGALWIDDLARIFGTPRYAEVPPPSWAEFAEVVPYAPEEYACYDWETADAFYSLIVSREADSEDSFFHAQLEVETADGEAYSHYYADIMYFQVDLLDESVTFFISHHHEYALPGRFKVDTRGHYSLS
jgi:hypothetical protein